MVIRFRLTWEDEPTEFEREIGITTVPRQETFDTKGDAIIFRDNVCHETKIEEINE